MKKLLSIILSITMLFSMATVAFADGIDGPMQKAKITVGINAEFAPFEYYDENGKLTGFDIDLMNYIGERISYDVDYVEMSFDKLIPAVVNGEVDCAVSAITATDERESVIDYTTPYLVAQSEVDDKIQYEEYAIVFPDNSIQKAKLAEASGHEFIYTLVNDAVNELIEDATVEKLIQKYELNENTKETGYSYYVLDSRYSEFIDTEAVPASPYKSILYNYDKVETATKVGDVLNFKAENVSEFHLAKVNEEQFTVGVIISDPDDIKKFYNEFVALKFTDNSDVEDAITILMRVKIDDELHIGDYYTHYGLFSGAYGENAETIEGLYISEQELYKIVEEMGYEWTLNVAGAGPTVSGDTAIVPLSDWAKDSVIKATDLGIMEAGKKYDFLNPITREEFCELIYNYCGNVLGMLATSDGKRFSDTDNPKIEVLSGMGIINGKTATEFAPNDLLTREEAATIMFRIYLDFKPETKLNKRPAVGVFLDDADISDWAYAGVYIMASEGIEVMVGDGNNLNYYPKRTFTTQEAIVALVRLYDRTINPETGNIIIKNAEDFSYGQIKELQLIVDSGHYPWRLDYEDVLKNFLNDKGINVKNGKITELAGGGSAGGISLTYSVEENKYHVELFQPIDIGEHGIWIVRSYSLMEYGENKAVSFYNINSHDNTRGEEIEKQEDGWYKLPSVVGSFINYDGEEPKSVTAFFTPAGTDTEQYEKQVGFAAPAWQQNPISVKLTFAEDDTMGHLYYALSYKDGSTVKTDLFNVLVEH